MERKYSEEITSVCDPALDDIDFSHSPSTSEISDSLVSSTNPSLIIDEELCNPTSSGNCELTHMRNTTIFLNENFYESNVESELSCDEDKDTLYNDSIHNLSETETHDYDTSCSFNKTVNSEDIPVSRFEEDIESHDIEQSLSTSDIPVSRFEENIESHDIEHSLSLSETSEDMDFVSCVTTEAQSLNTSLENINSLPTLCIPLNTTVSNSNEFTKTLKVPSNSSVHVTEDNDRCQVESQSIYVSNNLDDYDQIAETNKLSQVVESKEIIQTGDNTKILQVENLQEFKQNENAQKLNNNDDNDRSPQGLQCISYLSVTNPIVDNFELTQKIDAKNSDEMEELAVNHSSDTEQDNQVKDSLDFKQIAKSEEIFAQDINQISETKVNQLNDLKNININLTEKLNQNLSIPEINQTLNTSELCQVTNTSYSNQSENIVNCIVDKQELKGNVNEQMMNSEIKELYQNTVPDLNILNTSQINEILDRSTSCLNKTDVQELSQIANTKDMIHITDELDLNKISDKKELNQTTTTQDLPQIANVDNIENVTNSNLEKTELNIDNMTCPSTSSYNCTIHDYHKIAQSPSSSTDIKSSPLKNDSKVFDLNLTDTEQRENPKECNANSSFNSNNSFQEIHSAHPEPVHKDASSLQCALHRPIEEPIMSNQNSLYHDIIETHMEVGEYTTVETTEGDVDLTMQNIEDRESTSEDPNLVNTSNSHVTSATEILESNLSVDVTENLMIDSTKNNNVLHTIGKRSESENLEILPVANIHCDNVKLLVEQETNQEKNTSCLKESCSDMTHQNLESPKIEGSNSVYLTAEDTEENSMYSEVENPGLSEESSSLDDDILKCQNKLDFEKEKIELTSFSGSNNDDTSSLYRPNTSNGGSQSPLNDRQENVKNIKMAEDEIDTFSLPMIKREMEDDTILNESPVQILEQEKQITSNSTNLKYTMTTIGNLLQTLDENASETVDTSDALKCDKVCGISPDSLVIKMETNIIKEPHVLDYSDTKEELIYEENFDWDHYLVKTNSESAPPTAFLHVECSLEMGVKPDQTLEVMFVETISDSGPPRYLSYWPAKVVSSCGNLLRLQYICTTTSKSAIGLLEFWCDLSSSKIKPSGWSREHQIPLSVPPGFASDDLLVDEYSLKDLKSVPEEVFNSTKRELYNRVLEGCLLEILDTNVPYEGRIMKVLKNVGGRLFLTDFKSSEENWTTRSSLWIFFLDKRVKPLGWIKQEGEPYLYKNATVEELEELLSKYENSLPFSAFNSTPRAKHSVEPGMHLEAILPTTMQSMHVATVSRVIDDVYFELNIDDYSWITTIDDPFVLPCGYSDDMCLDIVPPTSGFYEPFIWESYLTTTGGKMVPKDMFPKHSTASESGFEEGQKLEIANPMDPNRICIATIERVLQHILLLKLDATPEYTFFQSILSTDLFPSGWAQSHTYLISIPSWYIQRSRNPSFNENEEMKSPLEQKPVVVNANKSTWTNYNSMWCRRLYINHCCYPGPFLSKNKVAKMSQSVGSGPVPLVLRDVISMTINSAYIPTRVLRELQNLKKLDSSWQSILMKAKFKRHILKAGVNIPSVGRDVKTFLMEFSRILSCCPNLWSFENLGENCPQICNKQNLSVTAGGTAGGVRGRGGIRCTFRRKKGGKKRLFYPIKSSATNQDENTEEFCDPDEGEEGEEGISESEGESRPSSPAASEAQRKLKPKRILTSLEITMNDSRGVDVKERSTKRSRGEFEVPEAVKTDEGSLLSNRKRARVEGDKGEVQNAIYGLETALVNSDPLFWSIDDVEKYVLSQPDISHHAVRLKDNEIDGRALLLLNLPSLVHHLGLPHPVAVILAQHICKVKMAHFTYYYPKYEKNGVR